MKIAVFGANGGIGSQVVKQGIETGHHVTAVVRNPATISLQHANLVVVKGDVLKPETLSAPLAHQDAVVSAIGIHKEEPTEGYSRGNANIMQAMQAAHVRRILCISASGLDPSQWFQRLVAKPLLWYLLKYSYIDLARMEALVSKSNLDWTIIRPPRLNDKPRTGKYRYAVNKQLPGSWFLSRADLADFILKHVSDPATYCGLIEVAN
jgi:putative NADH-flavin reductase